MALTTKLLKQALSQAELDPARAQAMLDGVRTRPSNCFGVLQRAWLVLVSAQLAWALHRDPEVELKDLQEAALVFTANQHHDQATLARCLVAQFAYSHGHLALALTASVQGFRNLRASVSYRLLAARAILWALSDQQDELSAQLLSEIRALCESAEMCKGVMVARSYLAFREFKRCLADAGIATHSVPFPGAASIPMSEARLRTGRLIADLESMGSQMREDIRSEPVPMLFLAAMKGFLEGPAACSALATEVHQACGAPAEAYALSAVGVAHGRHGEHAEAKRHLVRALEIFSTLGRGHEGSTWCFYLAQAHRALGEYPEALAAQEKFFADRLRVLDPLSSASTFKQAIAELQRDEAAALPTAPRPVHTNARPPHLTRTLRWMATHLAGPLAIGDIVAASGVSRRTLETAFRDYCGKTIVEELRSLRMHRARQLLRESGVTVSAVMVQVGYTSAPAFSKDFRKVFGVPPSRVDRAGALQI